MNKKLSAHSTNLGIAQSATTIAEARAAAAETRVSDLEQAAKETMGKTQEQLSQTVIELSNELNSQFSQKIQKLEGQVNGLSQKNQELSLANKTLETRIEAAESARHCDDSAVVNTATSDIDDEVPEFIAATPAASSSATATEPATVTASTDSIEDHDREPVGHMRMSLSGDDNEAKHD